MISYVNVGKDKHADFGDTGSRRIPRAIVMTDYHTVLLSRNSIKGICTLNEELIFEDPFDEVNSFLGF